MIEFFTTILESTNMSTTLGDMYEPVCAVIVAGGFLIPLIFTCDLFSKLITAIFKGGRI